MVLFPSWVPNKLKRLLFFTGGPINMNIQEVVHFGKRLKRERVAVDVFNFYVQKEGCEDSKRKLNAFVAAVNNNNNSHIQHFQAEPCTRFSYILSSTPEIFPLASREEGEIPGIKEWKGKSRIIAAARARIFEARERANSKPLENVSNSKPLENVSNRFKLLSLNNEKVKLGKGKMFDV
ncbi:uncharacterized protein [Rutidosis leptorrhynchoides]|uniref:uncharacterized protein isoform X1 n=1 Tax=Rutidosis leptorrhynchoides TaxID=125765 RepID=UPI003A99E3BC